MTLLRIDEDDSALRTRVVLIECPCGEEFPLDETVPHERINHFLDDHSPEDFGLSPLEDDRDQDDVEDVLEDERREVIAP